MKNIKLLQEVYGLRRKNFRNQESFLVVIRKNKYTVKLGCFKKQYKVLITGQKYFRKFERTTIDEMKDTLIEALKHLGFKDKVLYEEQPYTKVRLDLSDITSAKKSIIKSSPVKNSQKQKNITLGDNQGYVIGLFVIILLLILL